MNRDDHIANVLAQVVALHDHAKAEKNHHSTKIDTRARLFFYAIVATLSASFTLFFRNGQSNVWLLAFPLAWIAGALARVGREAVGQEIALRDFYADLMRKVEGLSIFPWQITEPIVDEFVRTWFFRRQPRIKKPQLHFRVAKDYSQVLEADLGMAETILKISDSEAEHYALKRTVRPLDLIEDDFIGFFILAEYAAIAEWLFYSCGVAFALWRYAGM